MESFGVRWGTDFEGYLGQEGWGVELRGELLAAALMAAMGGSGHEGSRGLGLWAVRE